MLRVWGDSRDPPTAIVDEDEHIPRLHADAPCNPLGDGWGELAQTIRARPEGAGAKSP